MVAESATVGNGEERKKKCRSPDDFYGRRSLNSTSYRIGSAGSKKSNGEDARGLEKKARRREGLAREKRPEASIGWDEMAAEWWEAGAWVEKRAASASSFGR